MPSEAATGSLLLHYVPRGAEEKRNTSHVIAFQAFVWKAWKAPSFGKSPEIDFIDSRDQILISLIHNVGVIGPYSFNAGVPSSRLGLGAVALFGVEK